MHALLGGFPYVLALVMAPTLIAIRIHDPEPAPAIAANEKRTEHARTIRAPRP